MLLCALAEAFRRWTGERAVLVDLEGHGREDALRRRRSLADGRLVHVDLPVVLLELDGAPDPAARLKAVKEQLRSIPNHGIGYGVLRYLCGDARCDAGSPSCRRPR